MSIRYGGGGLGVIQSFWNKGPTLATFKPKKCYKSELLKGDILRSYVNNRSNLAKNFSMLNTPSSSLQLGCDRRQNELSRGCKHETKQ